MYDLVATGEWPTPRLLMVASDRISTYDAVHPTPIPDKGKVLTGLSVFWFEKTAQIVANHLISATEGVPAEARGRALVVRRLQMLPVECVVRGYITGSGWKDYQATGRVSGIALPEGLRESERLPRTDLHAEHQGRGGPRRGDRLRARGRARRRPRADGARARRVGRAVLVRLRARARERRDPGRHEVRVRPGRAGAASSCSATRCSRPTPRATGRRRASRSGAASRASTSSTCATGPPRAAGTRSRRRRRSRRTWSRARARATSRRMS